MTGPGSLLPELRVRVAQTMSTGWFRYVVSRPALSWTLPSGPNCSNPWLSPRCPCMLEHGSTSNRVSLINGAVAFSGSTSPFLALSRQTNHHRTLFELALLMKCYAHGVIALGAMALGGPHSSQPG